MADGGWVKAVEVTASFPRRDWCVFRVDLTKLDGTSVSCTHAMAWGA